MCEGDARGVYYNEPQGCLEVFRPYALPDKSWLRDFLDQFRSQRLRGRGHFNQGHSSFFDFEPGLGGLGGNLFHDDLTLAAFYGDFITGVDSQNLAKMPRDDDLAFGGNYRFHGNTVLPVSRGV